MFQIISSNNQNYVGEKQLSSAEYKHIFLKTALKLQQHLDLVRDCLALQLHGTTAKTLYHDGFQPGFSDIFKADIFPKTFERMCLAFFYI